MNKGISRQEMLQQDLNDYNPKKWRINIPLKDYSLRMEDVVPALSGAIGKVALVAAFAVAWANGFGISDPSFVTENVRLEIILASIFTLVFCAFLNPLAAPPGTLAPLIPLIPVMLASGVHPLPLGILIGVFGLVITAFKYFDKVVEINGAGTKGGILLLFGFLGISSSLKNLQDWTNSNSREDLLLILIAVGVIAYLVLNRLEARWLIIPVCAAAALSISFLYSLYPAFETPVSFPVINPGFWWNEKWGIGFGITVENFLTALPFAMLAVVMWPIDALAVKIIQESNYPHTAKNAIFSPNPTFAIISIRNIIGSVLGGGQIAAIWRSFMIPLGVVKRPIGGSALLLAVFGICFGILGFPIDIAVFPPLIWLVLIFGVFIPLVEIGINTLHSMATVKIAVICLITGIGLSPVLGWSISLLVENFKIVDNKKDDRIIPLKDKIMTAAICIITIISYIVTSR